MREQPTLKRNQESFPAPKVSVCCMTYNHADYIAYAMEGFLAQRTDFPFEIIVHDDASTDGTKEILSHYEEAFPGMVRIIYEQENQYGKDTYQGGYIFGLMAKTAQGEYIALCEGDDYWIDQNKLQRQADYLDEHPECAETCHAARVVSGANEDVLGTMGVGTQERNLETPDIIHRWALPTASLMFRRIDAAEYAERWWRNDFSAEDFAMAVYLSSKGSLHYDPEEMSVYRYRTPGSWTARMKDPDNAASTSLKWICMCEHLDELTSREWHEDFVGMSKNHLKQALSLSSDKLKGSEMLEEALKDMTIKDWAIVMSKRILKLFGFGVEHAGFGTDSKRKIVRLETRR